MFMSRLKGRGSIPLTKESPFLEPFNMALVKLRESGVIQKILDDFAPENQENVRCEPKKVR